MLKAIIIAIVCVLGVLISGGIVAFIISTNYGYAYIAIVLMVSVNVAIRSVIFLKPSDMVAKLLFGGTYLGTVITSTFAESDVYQEWLKMIDTEDASKPIDQKRSRLISIGLFGNVAIIPWPFVKGLIFPNSSLSLPIHIHAVFTKEDGNNPNNAPSHQTRIQVKTTWAIRLSPLLSRLVEVLNVQRKHITDWTSECPFIDNDGHKYPNQPRMAKLLLEFMQPFTLESVRTAAKSFTWLGELDINEHRTEYEEKMLAIMCQKDSPVVHAGFFRAEYKAGSSEPFFGESALIVDVQIERIEFEPFSKDDSDLERASDEPMIALLKAQAAANLGRGEGNAAAFRAEGEAKAAVIRGRAEGEALQEKATASGLTTEHIYDGEVVKAIDKVQVAGVSEKAVKLVADIITGKSST